VRIGLGYRAPATMNKGRGSHADYDRLT